MKPSTVRVDLRIRLYNNSSISIDNNTVTINEYQPNLSMTSFRSNTNNTSFRNQGTISYAFDKIYLESSNKKLFSEYKSMIDEYLKFYGVTIMAYGQTGSGKTYSMGLEKCNLEKYIELANGDVHSNTDGHGLVLDSFDYIFKNRPSNVTFYFSFIEIYNDTVIDLLKDEKIRLFSGNNELCCAKKEIEVQNEIQLRKLLLEAICKRSVAATQLNQTSSRSHAIIELKMVQNNSEDSASPINMKSTLTFVDLAGSERLKRSQTVGFTKQESIKINESLLALGNVITDLANNKKFVNYRDCKLTRILQAKMKNSVIVLLACISGKPDDLQESLNTLKYASRAKMIQTHIKKAGEIRKRRLSVFDRLCLNEKVSVRKGKTKFNNVHANVNLKGRVIPVCKGNRMNASCLAATPSKERVQFNKSFSKSTVGFSSKIYSNAASKCKMKADKLTLYNEYVKEIGLLLGLEPSTELSEQFFINLIDKVKDLLRVCNTRENMSVDSGITKGDKGELNEDLCNKNITRNDFDNKSGNLDVDKNMTNVKIKETCNVKSNSNDNVRLNMQERFLNDYKKNLQLEKIKDQSYDINVKNEKELDKVLSLGKSILCENDSFTMNVAKNNTNSILKADNFVLPINTVNRNKEIYANCNKLKTIIDNVKDIVLSPPKSKGLSSTNSISNNTVDNYKIPDFSQASLLNIQNDKNGARLCNSVSRLKHKLSATQPYSEELLHDSNNNLNKELEPRNNISIENNCFGNLEDNQNNVNTLRESINIPHLETNNNKLIDISKDYISNKIHSPKIHIHSFIKRPKKVKFNLDNNTYKTLVNEIKTVFNLSDKKLKFKTKICDIADSDSNNSLDEQNKT